MRFSTLAVPGLAACAALLSSMPGCGASSSGQGAVPAGGDDSATGMGSSSAGSSGAGTPGSSGGGGETIDDASSGGSGDATTSSQSGADGGASHTASDASASSGDASATTAPGGYSVSGNTIYDASGKGHLFHGVDRTSFEWNAQGQYVAASDYTAMVAWKANVVRIPLNQDFWLSGSPIYDAGYAGVIDTQVINARAAGLDVILDLHWSDKGELSSASTSGLGTLPGQQRMADANSVTFWTQVATRYKGNGHVLFELYNEPHDVSWAVWQNGGDTGTAGAGGATFTAVGMQALYDAVRATGAKNLVLIGGLDWAYDLSGVPSNRIAGYNIAYVSHVYHHNTGHDSTDWPTSWGFLAATDPVVLTEFGPFSNQGSEVNCGLDFVTSLLDYADSKNVSWSSWAWWVYNSGGTDNGTDYCDYPSLLQSRPSTPNALGQIIQTRLSTYP